MKKCEIIAVLLLMVPLLQLSAQGKMPNELKKALDDNLIVVWNEDTANSSYFILSNKAKFFYSITQKSGLEKKTNHYIGKATYSNDTLFLHYNKGMPPNAVSYLVKEFTGTYFIQYYTDGRKRMFLRNQRRDFGHKSLPY